MLRRALRVLQYSAPPVPPHSFVPPPLPAAPHDPNAPAPAPAPEYNYNYNYNAARASRRPFADPASFVERVPRNTLLNIVPQGSQYVVERLGRYHCTLDSGMWFLLPLIDRIRYCYSVKERGVEIPNQSAITSDNVMVDIDGVLFLRIVDAEKASYNIDNPVHNLLSLAQTTMRSEIGRLDLDTLFRERAQLNRSVVEVLRAEARDWGIECKRYEIRDIAVSELVRRAMDLQADAERRKRQTILQSEGEARAEINRAEGLKVAQKCAADAARYSVEQRAIAEADATRVSAKAAAESIETVAETVKRNEAGAREAVSMRVAERYIEKFGELAKTSNTVVLGQNVGDAAGFATQALSVFETVNAGRRKLP